MSDSPDIPPPAVARRRRHDPRSLFYIVVLTIGAFALRAWNIDFGLPEMFHPDEERKVVLFTGVARGDAQWNFSHPPFMINAAAGALHLAEAVQGITDWNLTNFDQRLILGRLVTVIFGALTVVPVFLLARRLYGLTAAFAAGLAIAIAPMHVLNSRYLKEEIYLAFFVAVSALFFVKWVLSKKENPLNTWFFLSAISAAAAAASKYVGLFTVVTFLVIIITRRIELRARFKLAFLAFAISLLTFLVLCPQIFTHYAAFVRDFSYEAQHGATGANRETLFFWQEYDRGLFYIRHGILWGIGWPVALAAGISMILAFFPARRRNAILIVVGSTIAWYVLAELTPAKRGIGRDRYVLSCLPLLAVLAGGIIHHVRMLQIPLARLWACLLAAAIAIPSMLLTYEASAGMHNDTREQARSFFQLYYSEDNFRIVQFGGYDPIPHPKARITERSPMGDPWEETLPQIDKARFVTMSSFGLDRYEQFPDLNPDVIEMIAQIRTMFPYVARFEKDRNTSREFHNPVIEIRSRKSRPGWLYDGNDPAEKARDVEQQAQWKAEQKGAEYLALKRVEKKRREEERRRSEEERKRKKREKANASK